MCVRGMYVRIGVLGRGKDWGEGMEEGKDWGGDSSVCVSRERIGGGVISVCVRGGGGRSTYARKHSIISEPIPMTNNNTRPPHNVKKRKKKDVDSESPFVLSCVNECLLFSHRSPQAFQSHR